VNITPAPAAIELLLRRGDELAEAGDPRAAMSFYQEALGAARAGGRVDPACVPALQRAQQFIQSRASEFTRSLEQVVGGAQPETQAEKTRLTHALEMLTGKREIFPQRPSVFYYPYLAQRQFFEREEFEWIPELEARADVIRDELVALIDDDAEFRPYVEDEPNRPKRDFHGLNNDPSWSALYLWKDGKPVDENARRCPKTVAALEKVPLSRIGSRTPAVLFSRLEAGAHIPPHTGMLNSRLICHLPLIAPEGCWLRVGNETRGVEQGRMLIFDDSIEHEAKNPSAETRIILLFDIWRPELSEAERQAISAIFDAIDAFQTLPDA
jgi:hypothetical protein